MTSGLTIRPIKTEIFHAHQNLTEFVDQAVPTDLKKEGIILAVTSKIVSLAEGQLVPVAGIDKKSLVERESDRFFGEIGYGCFLTLKHGLLIPSAGIDESNSETGDYILFPKDPFESAHRLWKELKTKWKIQNLGILITDSHTTPLRRGVTGICLSYWGFEAVRNLVGTEDLFGRQLKMTQMNLVDGLASGAVLMMGEGVETQPLAVLTGAQVKFTETMNFQELQIPLEEDLYYPMLKNLNTISK